MLQTSSAWKGFCAEGLQFWRIKWYIQHAESVVFTGLPAWVYFFEKKFLRAKIVPKVSQVLCGLRDHFATTVTHLWAKCALSVGEIWLSVPF